MVYFESNHSTCLKADHNLLGSDILCIVNPKLPLDASFDQLKITGFTIVHPKEEELNDETRIILYRKNFVEIPRSTEFISYNNFQVLNYVMPIGFVSLIYVDSQISIADFENLEQTVQLIASKDNFCGIIGNFDFRPKYNPNSIEISQRLTALFSTLNLKRSFNQPTHLCGSQLDFVYVNENFQYPLVAGCYKNMYVKNSSIYLRLTSDKNAIPRNELPQKTPDNSASSNTPNNHLKIYFCIYCEEIVFTERDSVMCHGCNDWIHRKCLKVDEDPNKRLRLSTIAKSFVCKICKNND